MDELNGADAIHPADQSDLIAVRDLFSAPGPSPDVVAAGRARLLAALSEPEDPDPATGQDPGAGRRAEDTRPIGRDPGTGRPAEDTRHGGTGPGQRTVPGRGDRRPGGWSRREGRGRGPGRWAIVGGGLAGTAAAAILIVTTMVPSDGLIIISPDPGASASSVPSTRSTARQILLAAATAVAKTPAEGAYWHTRTVTGQRTVEPGRRYVIQRGSSRETWLAQRPGDQSWWVQQYLGAKPATPQDEAAWRAAGSPGSWRYVMEEVESSPRKPVVSRLRGRWTGSGGNLSKEPVSWAELRAMPGDPEELRAYLESRITKVMERYPEVNLEREMESRLQGSCMEILSGMPVSPEVRASAYQILASLPGMRAEGEVTDPLGRTGQALSYEMGGRGGRQGRTGDVRFVIDPESGLPLANETKSVGKLADGRAVEVGSFTAYEEIGWTDKKPDLEESGSAKPGAEESGAEGSRSEESRSEGSRSEESRSEESSAEESSVPVQHD
ncbi:CU044_5270 family protein [Streptosporangium sp. NPDC000396]|uniref:CU044_5270 family protein n=1 Tax=Streptosporangium sp. NPDC000396 TaxID=3366185 RepID=UPI0036A2098C